jgi:glycosyltransferase involved in cell wall biosynthesis
MRIPFFSIIIPVYNDEKDLPRCLDSVLSQTFNDFELLLIDDGSTDNCPALCDEYANKDSRIRLFHKSNEGISKTRQFGISNAIGDYTIFVDSDDWIECSFLATVEQKLNKNKADILLLDFFKEDQNGSEKVILQKPVALDTETIIRMVLEQRISSCLWSVVIKKDFYNSNKVIFYNDINYGEDSLFIIELLLNNPNIDYLERAFYHHTCNRISFTRTNKKQRFEDRNKFLCQMSFLLEKYKRNDMEKYNFFPLSDKYLMLTSGIFTKKEYQAFFSPPITYYYMKRCGFKNYFLLTLAETQFYSLARFFAVSIEQFKNRLCGKRT